MMPEIDGIETTKRLREMGYTHPIVALTANAVAGQAQIFLGNGFDDFISKPIDVRQLNAVLNRLIRDRKPPEVVEEARQRHKAKQEQESDNKAPQSQPAIDPLIAEIFLRDAKKSIEVLDNIVAKGSPYSNEDLRTYVIHVHGLKSALANIGKDGYFRCCAQLEELGRDENFKALDKETPAFLSSLKAYVEEISPKEEEAAAETVSETEEDKSYLREKLLAIKSACEKYDESTAEEILKELRIRSWSQPTKEVLSTISENLLHSDFDEATDAVNKFLKDE